MNLWSLTTLEAWWPVEHTIAHSHCCAPITDTPAFQDNAAT